MSARALCTDHAAAAASNDVEVQLNPPMEGLRFFVQPATRPCRPSLVAKTPNDRAAELAEAEYMVTVTTGCVYAGVTEVRSGQTHRDIVAFEQRVFIQFHTILTAVRATRTDVRTARWKNS